MLDWCSGLVQAMLFYCSLNQARLAMKGLCDHFQLIMSCCSAWRKWANIIVSCKICSPIGLPRDLRWQPDVLPKCAWMIIFREDQTCSQAKFMLATLGEGRAKRSLKKQKWNAAVKKTVSRVNHLADYTVFFVFWMQCMYRVLMLFFFYWTSIYLWIYFEITFKKRSILF